MPEEYYPYSIDSLNFCVIDSLVYEVDNTALSTAWTSIQGTNPTISEDQMWYLEDAIDNLPSSEDKTQLLIIYNEMVGEHPPRRPH